MMGKKKTGMKGMPIYGAAKGSQDIGPGLDLKKVKKEKLQKPKPLK